MCLRTGPVGLVRVRGAAPVPPDLWHCALMQVLVCACVSCVSFVRASLLHVYSTVFLFRELPHRTKERALDPLLDSVPALLRPGATPSMC